MKDMKKVFCFSVFLFLSLLFVSSAEAARLYLVPDGKVFGIGQEFSVDVKIDTDDSINAA